MDVDSARVLLGLGLLALMPLGLETDLATSWVLLSLC